MEDTQASKIILFSFFPSSLCGGKMKYGYTIVLYSWVSDRILKQRSLKKRFIFGVYPLLRESQSAYRVQCSLQKDEPGRQDLCSSWRARVCVCVLYIYLKLKPQSITLAEQFLYSWSFGGFSALQSRGSWFQTNVFKLWIHLQAVLNSSVQPRCVYCVHLQRHLFAIKLHELIMFFLWHTHRHLLV